MADMLSTHQKKLSNYLKIVFNSQFSLNDKNLQLTKNELFQLIIFFLLKLGFSQYY